MTKNGDTISLEYDVCSFLFSVTVSPNVTSDYDVGLHGVQEIKMFLKLPKNPLIDVKHLHSKLLSRKTPKCSDFKRPRRRMNEEHL